MSSQQAPEQPDKKKNDPNAILRYSGMAFQMAAIMFVGVFIGKKIDSSMGNEKPVAMLISVIIAMIAAFYLTLKDFFIQKKD